MRFLAAAFLFLAALVSARADNAPAPVTNPALVAAHYHEILARPQFHAPDDADMNDQMKDWLSEWFMRLGQQLQQFRYAPEMPRFASMITSTLVVAALVGLVYVAYRLLRGRRVSDYPDRREEVSAPVLRPPEFYEEELRRATAAGDWHAAWLASWRQFLSRLEKEKLVPADRSRTNREYLAQLRAVPQNAPALTLVGTLVDAYDRFIYGKRAIAETEWRQFQNQIDEAGLLLHLSERPGLAARAA